MTTQRSEEVGQHRAIDAAETAPIVERGLTLLALSPHGPYAMERNRASLLECLHGSHLTYPDFGPDSPGSVNHMASAHRNTLLQIKPIQFYRINPDWDECIAPID